MLAKPRFHYAILVKFLLVLVLQCQLYSSLAQSKYEKETRLKENEVPLNAMKFVDSLGFSKKVKWYKEQGFDRTSVEAKVKKDGQKYSIEFSTDGTFEDVEIVHKLDELPLDTRTSLLNFLEEKYGKFSIEKIQVQYSGNQSKVLHFLIHDASKKEIDVHFEVVISAKVDGAFEMYEYLFSESGDFVNRSKIVLKSTDNIVY